MIMRKTDNVKEFKNGNLNIRFSAEEISDINNDSMMSGFTHLMHVLDWIDCYMLGDSFCWGNFKMFQRIYNAHSNICYYLDLDDIDAILMRGQTLKLYAHKPDAEEMELIKREMGVGA